ncbi:hypothetical protein BG004_002829 [Podila humilis]|nr:hypothetical protein BG004_002829 [Podila humilis]
MSLTTALPVERRRNPLATIILGGGSGRGNSQHSEGGHTGINLGLGLRRPGGLILGRRSEQDTGSNSNGRRYHTQPWSPVQNKKRSNIPEEQDASVPELGDQLHSAPYPPYKGEIEKRQDTYKPGGHGSGGGNQFDKCQPYGR